jgi:predicted dehydrogenase
MWHRNGSWRRPVPNINFDPRPWGYPDLEHLINWRMYKVYSGGLMAELGSHMMQIVNLIYGKMPTAVTGFGGIDYYKDGRDTYDDVSVIYKYPDGQRAIFTSLTTNAHDGERMQIMGTEGTLNFGWNDALYYREKEQSSQTKDSGATVIGSTGETMKATTGGDQKGTKIDTPQDRRRMDAGYLAMESFINCVREGKNPEVDVNEGRKSAICILTANQAMEQNKVMKVIS